MQRTIAIAGITAASFGFAPVTFAQAGSPSASPAELLGVQERSIQTNSKPTRTVPLVDSAQSTNLPREGGLVLYRIDRNTRVLVGPVGSTSSNTDLPTQSQQGDNRLQLLRDLEE